MEIIATILLTDWTIEDSVYGQGYQNNNYNGKTQYAEIFGNTNLGKGLPGCMEQIIILLQPIIKTYQSVHTARIQVI